MRESYKVSQIASIFGISRRTLIYYDEINLFKPHHIDEENGYRYYLEHQVYELRFILALKKSGFSLKDIKKYTECKKVSEGRDFLENKVIDMKAKIKELENSIEVIEKKCSELSKAETSEGLKPSVGKNKEFKAIVIPVDSPYNYFETEKAHKRLAEIEKKLSIKDKVNIAIVSKEKFNYQGIYSLTSLGTILQKEVPYDKVLLFNIKKYATITHKKSFESLWDSYEKLFHFIERNSYEIIGDSIEISYEGQMQLEKGVGEIIEIFIPIK